MDLAIGAKSVFVMMTLFAKEGHGQARPALHLPADRARLRGSDLYRLRHHHDHPRRGCRRRDFRRKRRGAARPGGGHLPGTQSSLERKVMMRTQVAIIGAGPARCDAVPGTPDPNDVSAGQSRFKVGAEDAGIRTREGLHPTRFPSCLRRRSVGFSPSAMSAVAGPDPSANREERGQLRRELRRRQRGQRLVMGSGWRFGRGTVRFGCWYYTF